MQIMNMRSKLFWAPICNFFGEVEKEDPERLRWTAEYQLQVLMEACKEQWDNLPHSGPAAHLQALQDFRPELLILQNFLNHPERLENDSSQGVVARLRAIATSVAGKHEDLAVSLAKNSRLPF